jgi:hypothetical protein
MSNKILIPLLVLIPLIIVSVLIGGTASYFLFKVNTTQAPIVSNNQQILDSAAQKVLDSVSSISSVSKVVSSKLVQNSSDNNGESKLIKIYGTITAPVRIAENIPTICLNGNEQKFCKPEIKVVSPNVISYNFFNVPNNSYDLTYSYNFKDQGGWMILPDRGVLADFTYMDMEENGKVEFNVPLESFERLRQEKIQKLKYEFGSRPDCVKQTDYFYKCSGVGSVKSK